MNLPSAILLSANLLSHSVYADSHSTLSTSIDQAGHSSAMTDYKKLDENDSTTWKQANDTVREIGGWRTYANETYRASQITQVDTAETQPTPGTSDPFESEKQAMPSETKLSDAQKKADSKAIRPTSSRIKESVIPSVQLTLTYQ